MESTMEKGLLQAQQPQPEYIMLCLPSQQHPNSYALHQLEIQQPPASNAAFFKRLRKEYHANRPRGPLGILASGCKSQKSITYASNYTAALSTLRIGEIARMMWRGGCVRIFMRGKGGRGILLRTSWRNFFTIRRERTVIFTRMSLCRESENR